MNQGHACYLVNWREPSLLWCSTQVWSRPKKLLTSNFPWRLVEVSDQSYSQKMPTVFFREGNYIFHRSEDCVQLNKKPARGTAHPVNHADLKDLRAVRPCHTCYPDAPKFKAVRRFCPKCNKKRTFACPHNGGVPVVISYETNYIGLLKEPGYIVNKPIHVWPDQLYRYVTGAHSHQAV